MPRTTWGRTSGESYLLRRPLLLERVTSITMRQERASERERSTRTRLAIISSIKYSKSINQRSTNQIHESINQSINQSINHSHRRYFDTFTNADRPRAKLRHSKKRRQLDWRRIESTAINGCSGTKSYACSMPLLPVWFRQPLAPPPRPRPPFHPSSDWLSYNEQTPSAGNRNQGVAIYGGGELRGGGTKLLQGTGLYTRNTALAQQKTSKIDDQGSGADETKLEGRLMGVVGAAAPR